VLNDKGILCGKNRGARIMRGIGIRATVKKKFKKTTYISRVIGSRKWAISQPILLTLDGMLNRGMIIIIVYALIFNRLD